MASGIGAHAETLLHQLYAAGRVTIALIDDDDDDDDDVGTHIVMPLL